MADLDIYGDLCADLPSSSPLASPGSVASPPPEDAPPSSRAAVQASSSSATARRVSRGSGSPAEADKAPPHVSAGGTSAKKGPQTWVAPGYEDWTSSGFVVAGGEVVGISADTEAGGDSQDFEALRQELAAAEKPRAVATTAVASSATKAAACASSSPENSIDANADTDDSDDDSGDDVQLGEVHASQTGARPLHKPPGDFGQPAQSSAQKDDASRASGASAAASGERALKPRSSSPDDEPKSPAECYVLVGGLPPTMSNTELRKLAEQFGQIKSMRVLEEPGRSMRSAGIALLEYATPDGAIKAAGVGNGLCALSAWLLMGVPSPRLVLVSQELLGMMRAGTPPWPEGGPCSDNLRYLMVRQFDMWNLSARRRPADSPPRGLRRANSSGSFDGPRQRSPGNGRGRKGEGWEDQLKALKRKVNSKLEPIEDVKRLRP